MRDLATRRFDDFWPFYVSQHRRPGTRVGDFKMYGLMLRGKMTAEVERLGHAPAPISA